MTYYLAFCVCMYVCCPTDKLIMWKRGLKRDLFFPKQPVICLPNGGGGLMLPRPNVSLKKNMAFWYGGVHAKQLTGCEAYQYSPRETLLPIRRRGWRKQQTFSMLNYRRRRQPIMPCRRRKAATIKCSVKAWILYMKWSGTITCIICRQNRLYIVGWCLLCLPLLAGGLFSTVTPCRHDGRRDWLQWKAGERLCEQLWAVCLTIVFLLSSYP